MFHKALTPGLMYPGAKGFCVKTFGFRTPAFPWTPIHLKSGHSSNKNLSQYPLSSASEVKEFFLTSDFRIKKLKFS